MKLKTLLLAPYSLLLILCSCGASKPITTSHHERIETQLQPIPISADTIEITLHSRDAACCVRSPQRSKNNVTSVEIQRALLTKSNSESLNPNQRSLNRRRKNGKKSFQSVLSVGEKNNSVRIKSTRGVSMQTTHTDTTQTLQITLRPDTIYIPYTTHIRSDTIIAPDPTIKAKLTTARWQIVALILILIAIIIILFLRQNDKKT